MNLIMECESEAVLGSSSFEHHMSKLSPWTVQSQAPNKAPANGGSSFNQLLGIKGASQETVSLHSEMHYVWVSQFWWIMVELIISWDVRFLLKSPSWWSFMMPLFASHYNLWVAWFSLPKLMVLSWSCRISGRFAFNWWNLWLGLHLFGE